MRLSRVRKRAASRATWATTRRTDSPSTWARRKRTRSRFSRTWNRISGSTSSPGPCSSISPCTTATSIYSIRLGICAFSREINYLMCAAPLRVRFWFHRLALEFPASGGILTKSHTRTSKLLRYVATFDYVVATFEVLFVLFTVYFTIEELLDVIKWHHLKNEIFRLENNN